MSEIERELEGFKNDPATVSVHYSSEKDLLDISLYFEQVQSDRESAYGEALRGIRTLHIGWTSRGQFSFGEHLTFLKYFIPESGRKVSPEFISQTEQWLLNHTKIWVQSPYGKNDGQHWVMCEAWLKEAKVRKCWDNNLKQIPIRD